MAETGEAPERVQFCLVTPPVFELSEFPLTLAACLDRTEIACVRLALTSHDAERIGRAADTLRGITAERDVALVIDRHTGLVERHGLDGVHLTDGARSVLSARKALAEDTIVGAECAASRHDGMTAGELGADYVQFGPVSLGDLGSGDPATHELFAWWSEMIEVPVIAAGGLTEALVRDLAPVADFIALGDELWDRDDPVQRLAALVAASA